MFSPWFSLSELVHEETHLPLDWSKADEKGLARFVNADEAKKLLAVSQNTAGHPPSSPEDRRSLLRCIYDEFLRKEIKYSLEPYHSSKAIQRIRSPEEVIYSHGEGTCLDLSLVFSAACLANELLPILVIFEGHAFVIVSLEHGLRNWDEPSRTLENELFATDVVRDQEIIRKFIVTGRYLAIECTGFARTKTLSEERPEGMGRNDDGFLSFERAVIAGREHFDTAARKFRLALDIQIAHCSWRIDPPTRPAVQHLPVRDISLEDIVRDELDRKEQVMAFELPLKTIPHVPYIFLICGEESHGPFYLRLRLRKKELPRILRDRGFDQRLLHENDHLTLGIQWKGLSEDNYRQSIWNCLIRDTMNVNRDGLINHLKSAPFPLVIETDLNVQGDLGLLQYLNRDHQIQNIKYFFKFWQEEWHPLEIQRPVIVLLYLRYKIRRTYATRWMAEKTLKAEIKNLKSKIQESSENLEFKDVPELALITADQAEEFSEQPGLTKIFSAPVRTINTIIADFPMEKGVAFMDFFDKLVEYQFRPDHGKKSKVS